MRADDLFQAFGDVGDKYVKSVNVFTRTVPHWRVVMKKTTKFAVSAAAAVLALVFLFGAWFLQSRYGVQAGETSSALGLEDPAVLRVVIEEEVGKDFGYSHSVLYGISQVVKMFKLEHPQVQVKVQVLPKVVGERAEELEKLRTEILTGNGPDLYLLPTEQINGLTDEKTEPIIDSYGNNLGFLRATVEDVEPLFPDVRQAMENGVFLDLSAYYDQDELTRGLQSDVMDGGVLDGRRLVLPLGWNMPVLYADRESLAAHGLTPEELPRDLPGLQKLALESGDAALIYGVAQLRDQTWLDVLEGKLDYATGNCTISEEELTRTLLDQIDLWEQWTAYCEENWDQVKWSVDDVAGKGRLASGIDWYTVPIQSSGSQEYRDYAFGEDHPLQVGWLAQAAENVAVAQSLGRELEVLPLTTPSGEQSAHVTFWGAVDAKTQHPRLAYELLRMFLGREVQLQEGYEVEENRENGRIDLDVGEPVPYACPVLIEGSVKGLARATLTYLGTGRHHVERYRALQKTVVGMTDDMLPALEVKLDRVRFLNGLDEELGDLVRRDYPDDPAQREAQVRQAVQEFLRQVRYRLGEG